ALSAERSARAAREAAERLWLAYPAQARANRFDGVLGRKAKSLQAIATAAQIRPSLELRSEAIATLAVFDLKETEVLRPLTPGLKMVDFSSDLEEYSVLDGDKLRFFNTRTGSEVRRTVLP